MLLVSGQKIIPSIFSCNSLIDWHFNACDAATVARLPPSPMAGLMDHPGTSQSANRRRATVPNKSKLTKPNSLSLGWLPQIYSASWLPQITVTVHLSVVSGWMAHNCWPSPQVEIRTLWFTQNNVKITCHVYSDLSLISYHCNVDRYNN